MSRSKPQSGGGSKSPVKFRFEFGGKTGEIKYYDKETKENVFLSDLRFIVLDRRSSITGFSESENTSIYSNLVKNLKNEQLLVRAGKKTLVEGVYSDIKEKISGFDGKFTTNILLLADMDGKWEMGNLQLTSSGLSGWMNFEEGKDGNGDDLKEGKPDIEGSIITITKGVAKKKGAVKYVVPAFTTEPLPTKLDALAMEQDILLQAYFDGLGESNQPEPEKPTSKPVPKGEDSKKSKQEEEEDDDLPF